MKWMIFGGCGLIVLGAMFPAMLWASGLRQVTIVQTASTNVRGLKVTFDRKGNATITEIGKNYQIHAEESNQKDRSVKLPPEICARFFNTLATMGSLEDIAVGQCMKSASFGTSWFIEQGGERSPDISCPGDARTDALWKQTIQIVQVARKTLEGIH